MKNLPAISALIYAAPWAVLPAHHAHLSRLYASYLRGELRTGANFRENYAAAAAAVPGRSQYRTVRVDTARDLGLAVVEISGYVGNRIGAMEAECFDCCDLADLSAALDGIADDTAVSTVVFHINSPGGTATGLPEVAAKIEALGVTRRTVAYTSDMACSAAYWLAAACAEIHAMPSACIGSIGVYFAALDSSRAMEMDGLELKLWRDGALKGMGLPGKTWTAEEESHMREQLAWWSAKFKGYIAARRPGIPAALLEGQAMPAETATGMVDGYTATLSDLLATLF